MNISKNFDIKKCSGCCACADVCRFSAISMVYDKNTFHLVPKVDANKCKDCSLCLSVCPIRNTKPTTDFKSFGFAAVANDDIKKISSSGGMFLLIANEMLKNGGYVAGAIFDENFNAVHTVTNDYEIVKKMSGSKYVQSNTAGIYKKVKQLLDNQNKVLFTGTPCQVAGLKRYLNKDYSNLLAVDIFCHGVPSQYIFSRYLEENFDKKAIANILFRNKAHLNGSPGSMTIKLKNGKEIYSEYYDNSYYEGFSRKITIRKSCFHCQYAENNRIGDLSIGDFWGAKFTDTKIDYRKGCSIVLINNKKGEAIWNIVSKKVSTIESYDIPTLTRLNRNKVELKAHPQHEKFPAYFKKYNSVKVAIDKIINKEYKVGIYGILSNPNYGGQITYYALYQAVKKMGCSVSFINKPYKDRWPKFFDITAKLCNITDRAGLDNLEKYNANFDIFLLGSDQTWNYRLFSPWKSSLYFDFVHDDKTKIAYASSFGHNYHNIPEENKCEISFLFKRFNNISVREKDGVDILKKSYNVDAAHVLDPVFLIDKDEYIKLGARSKIDAKNHIGTYIMGPTDFKLTVVEKIAAHLGKKCVQITDGTPSVFDEKRAIFNQKNMEPTKNATIYDWLNVIINSDFVITDSYHASCFCFLFKKPFVLLQEHWALSRIESMFNEYNLNSRWIKDFNINEFKISDKWFEKFDDNSYTKLTADIKRCNKWLEDAIKSPNKLIFNNSFVPLNSKKRLEDYFFFMTKKKNDYILICSTANINTNLLSKVDFKCNLSFKHFNAVENQPYMFIYDYFTDKFIEQSGSYIEHKINSNFTDIIILLGNKSKRINSIFVNNKDGRSETRLNPNSNLSFSVFSKSKNCIVDSFDVVLDKDTAFIKRP